MSFSGPGSESEAPLPVDQQRLFSEIARLHEAHVRIEAMLKSIVDGQKVIDSFTADAQRNGVGLTQKSCGRWDESKSLVDPFISAGSDVPVKSSASKGKPTEIIESENSRSDIEAGFRSNVEGSSAFVASNLPLGWPEVLTAHGELNNMKATSTGEPRVSMSVSRKQTNFNSWTRVSEKETVISRYVIDPNSKFHMTWSASSVFLLIWDLTTVPYVLAWDIELTGFLYIASLVTPLFWSVDLIVNFFTAFYSGGELQQSLKTIWRSYSRSYFAPDLIVVLCDWSSIVISETSRDGSNSSRSLRFLRFSKLGRLLRIISMLRVLRLVRIIQDFASFYLTEFTRIGFQLVNLMLGIFWAAHVLACLWYGIGKAGLSDTGARWAETFEVEVDGQMVPLMEAGETYQYAVSLHWACAQVALGSIDVMPRNSFERLTFIFAMMCGFLFGSTVVSSLSAAMMDYQMMQKDKTLTLRMLRRYLSENGVEAKLFLTVTKQAEQRLAHRKALDEKDVIALDMISSTLRSHLRYEIQKPYLSSHPMLRLWASLDALVVHRICASAVNFVSVRHKDDLFMPGVVSNVAYILVSGEMMYSQTLLPSHVQSDTREEVRTGKWMCEAALWVQWTTVGLCEAMTPCKLLEISAPELIKGMQLDMVIRDVGVEYGKQFHKRVISACPPHSPYPTDLHVPFTDYCDLVVSMAPRVQVVIGQDALHHLSTSGLKVMDQLEREVDSSKSIVVVEGNGAIIRVVSLIVLEVTNENGEVFMQVGKWSGTAMKGVCQLPGLKQERDELVGEAVNRFLATKMPTLIGKLEYFGINREINEKASKEYGVQTRYLRSVCSAMLKSGEVLESPVCCVQLDKDMTCMMSGNWSEAEQHQNQLLNTLLSVKVQVVYDANEAPNLFAWLSPEQASMLGTSSCDRILQKWASSLSFPEAAVESGEVNGVWGGRREQL